MQEPIETGTVGALLAEIRDLRRQVFELEKKAAVVDELRRQVATLSDVVGDLESRSGLMNSKLWRRALAVWGHNWLAQLVIGLSLAVVLFVVSALASGGPGPPASGAFAPTARPTVRPTRTPRPTATVRPSRTPRPTATADISSGAWADCLSWRQIDLDDVGRDLCVWGYLSSVGDNGEAYFMYFSGQTGDFYALSYTWWWPELERRDCIVVEGEVKRLGSSPVIVVEDREGVGFCD